MAIIPQNGETDATLQDVGLREASPEMLALLELLALGREEMVRGDTAPIEGLADRIRTR